MNRLVYPSKNYNNRPVGVSIKYIILHGTEVDKATSLHLLTDDTASIRVSSHYLIDENGQTYQLVEDINRAWHAGVSQWKEDTGLNDISLGIELVNIPPAPFPKAQLEALVKLCGELMETYSLDHDCLLAHSDIALGRKVDPGPSFDWAYLATKGIGIFPQAFPEGAPTSLKEIQRLLKEIGYGIDVTGQPDEKTRLAIKAFQMRFRPSLISGEIDLETTQLLREYRRLIKIVNKFTYI